MSHHRETVTAVGAPKAAGPYSHAVKGGGLIFLSGQTPIDPDTGSLVEGDIGAQTKRCLDNLAIVAAAAGASLEDAVRCGIYVTDMATFKDGQRGLRRLLRRRAARAQHDRRRVAAAGRRRRDRRDPCRPGLTRVTAADIEAARPEVERVARRTPVLSTRTISERAGGIVALKAENLQRTGSFKVRGASAKLAALGAAGCADGVVAASAGNHAQGLAAAAAARGVRCEVFVPADAPIAKAEAARGQGATSTSAARRWTSASQRRSSAREEGGLAFVHPFDDPDIVAGQGSLGLELLEEVPDLAKIVVPVGGGGLASGIAIAVKSARPEVEVVGVQVAACAPYPASLEAGAPVPATSALTIADGIAVKRPGDLTLALLGEWLDGMAVVDDEDAAEAMFVLLERCKLVVEGAGAVGVAALLGGQVAPAAARHDGRDPVGRQRRPRAAALDRPPARDARRPPPGRPDARAGPPGRARGAARAASPRPAGTSSTSRTCARASTCTCARRRSSWCSRRAGASTPSGC